MIIASQKESDSIWSKQKHKKKTKGEWFFGFLSVISLIFHQFLDLFSIPFCLYYHLIQRKIHPKPRQKHDNKPNWRLFLLPAHRALNTNPNRSNPCFMQVSHQSNIATTQQYFIIFPSEPQSTSIKTPILHPSTIKGLVT